MEFAPCRKNLCGGVSAWVVGVAGILVEPLDGGLAEAGYFACKAHRDRLALGIAMKRLRPEFFRCVDPLRKGDGVLLASGEEGALGVIQLLGEFVLAQYGFALIGDEGEEVLYVLFGA